RSAQCRQRSRGGALPGRRTGISGHPACMPGRLGESSLQSSADADRTRRNGPLGATGDIALENHDDVQRDIVTPKATAASNNPRNYTPAAEAPPAMDAEPQSLRQWLAGNGITSIIVIAALVFLFIKLDPLAIIKVAIGLSLVIFLHELGHF